MEVQTLLLCLLITATAAQEPCGGSLRDWMGEFSSPRYPSNYPDNARCMWTIHSTGGSTRVLLTFTDIFLETCCDYIRVYDGPSTLYPLLGEIREDESKYYNSSSNDLTVLFLSDDNISRRGFHANWVFLDSNSCRNNCGFHLGTCSCDDSCPDNRNCCFDYNSYCSQTTTTWPTTTDIPSCMYNCGYSLSSCSCTDFCQRDGNCCPDYETYCSTTATTLIPDTTAHSCMYNCGYDFGSCSCAQNCHYYDTCCPDYDSHCPPYTTRDLTTGLQYSYKYHLVFNRRKKLMKGCNKLRIKETQIGFEQAKAHSCMYNCGYDFGSCSCAQNCHYYDTCCPDYDSHCPAYTTDFTRDFTRDFTTGFPSCKYNCGYSLSSCSCTHNCQYYGNCCPDYNWYCPSYTTENPVTHPRCGGHLFGSGMFSSPNYPYYYHDNAYCVWYLSAQQGQRIFLTFADVQLERCCNCDYITVHDGSSTGHQQLGKVCFNDTTHQAFHSTSRYLTIVFRSDYTSVSHGFKALFTSSLTADQGRVDCSSDKMVIVIQRSYLNSLGLSGNDLYVDDHVCRPTVSSSEVVFRFPLDTCGTAKEMMNGFVSYGNNVRASQSQSGEITRQSEFLLHVGCRMEPDTMVQILYRASEITNANITGTGRFNASIAFYTSSSFTQQIYESPYKVDLNQFLYVQVRLTRPDSSLDLFLDTCVASPNPENFKDHSYDLLRNGCPKDSTYLSYANVPKYAAGFRFRAFKFLRTHAFVYLQCKAIICPDNDYNSRCRRGCQYRRKRSLDSTYNTSTVTLGPIKLKG